MNQQELGFNIQTAHTAKVEGMNLAATNRALLLSLARQACVRAAEKRPERTASADDAFQYLKENALPSLGSASGSIFRTKNWEFTEQWLTSSRVTNHARLNRVWKLR